MSERLGRFTPAKWRETTERKILLAGEDGRISPDRVFLLKLVSASLSAALGYLLYRQYPYTIVLGLAEGRHLTEALQAVEAGPLPEAAIEGLRAIWDGDPAFRN